MRKLPLLWGILVLAGPLVLTAAGQAQGQAQGQDTTLDFAVMRNGERIGSSTIRLHRRGRETTAEIATQIRVTIAYITVYRFDQRESERWIDGRLAALTSVTDDNGTVHRVSAQSRGDRLVVDADGKVSEVDAAVVPASFWNASLVRRTMALNPQDGKVTPVSVVDHGEEKLVLQGRATMAHHYSIRTSFPQDVWYDAHHRLVKVELRGSDGSTIWYRPG